MTAPDVKGRWERLRESYPALHLYALVDGIQYQTHLCKKLKDSTGMIALFAGTPDAPLAHAGPWLIDVARISRETADELAALERDAPSVTWLIALQDIRGLAQLLQLRLNIRLPDGRSALLRFWDPRVLANLAQTLFGKQRDEFFGHIYEWLLLHEGQRVRIGGRHADID